MSNIEIVSNSIPVDISIETFPVDIVGSTVGINVDVIDPLCETVAELYPITVDNATAPILVDSVGGIFDVNSSVISVELTEANIEFIEVCAQGPAGPAGPPGSGGLALNEQVLTGDNKLIYTLPLALYNMVNFQLSINDLVNDFQVYKDLQYTFGTPNIKCRVSGINRKDNINHQISYVKTATTFDVYLKNNTPNTLLVKGLVFPV